MAEETIFQGIRLGDGWLSQAPITMEEARAMIESHMRGANLNRSYWLEEEGDHLAADFFERQQPRSQGFPGGDDFPKDETWRHMARPHSDKRREYPNP